MKEKRCPFNRFKPCIGDKCGAQIIVNRESQCSFSFAAHELFILAELLIPRENKAKKDGSKEEIPCR
jgi:hypothetical protein